MANKTVALRIPAALRGQSLTMVLLQAGSIVNGSGDTVVEGSNGWGTATVTEPAVGWSDVELRVGGVVRAEGGILRIPSDVEGTYLVDDPSIVPAKTDLIGTGVLTPASPVTEQSRIPLIYIGDDYLAANNRAFQFTIPDPGWASGTCKFGGRGQQTGDTWNVSGTVTDQGTTWLLSFDMSKAVTGSLSVDLYDWSVEIVNASGDEHTIVSSVKPTVVKQKQT